MNDAPVFSVIAPIFNEIGNLPEFYRRVKESLDQTGESLGAVAGG